MIGYMSLEEQVDADFTRARRKALLRRIGARLRRDAASAGLLRFEEVRKVPGAVGGVHRGRRTVPLGQIAGSVGRGRYSEFDRAFLPAKASVETRWPVKLHKFGGAYFVLDGHHRVSVYRYHGIEWVDAVVTEFLAQSGTPSPLERTRPRIIEETKEHTMPNKPPGREDPKERENAASAEGIEVRWGLREDEEGIVQLMELNGLLRAMAFEERFIVAAAKPGGKVLAALQYRTEPKRLLLGLLVSDPWVEERPLAVALYAGAGELAREMGAREVLARSVLHAEDYPYEAGYRWRYPGGWHLDATRLLHRRKELPAGGWRRMVTLLGVPAVPFFRAFRGAGRWIDGPR